MCRHTMGTQRFTFTIVILPKIPHDPPARSLTLESIMGGPRTVNLEYVKSSDYGVRGLQIARVSFLLYIVP